MNDTFVRRNVDRLVAAVGQAAVENAGRTPVVAEMTAAGQRDLGRIDHTRNVVRTDKLMSAGRALVGLSRGAAAEAYGGDCHHRYQREESQQGRRFPSHGCHAFSADEVTSLLRSLDGWSAINVRNGEAWVYGFADK